MCGGTAQGGRPRGGREGLSPRVRGNLQHRAEHLAEIGSIPACAGEPVVHCVRGGSDKVYPRVCGGTTPPAASDPVSMGLSPRVRGNLVGHGDPVGVKGSIPACAGEPDGRVLHRFLGRVYPRVCGGTSDLNTTSYTSPGLSPRVRGNRSRASTSAPCPGSIPACAGEPLDAGEGGARLKVYPRVCGGTLQVDQPGEVVEGLSPRVRGNPTTHNAKRLIAGSIPACAGEPARWPASSSAWRVYPRVCGGTAGCVAERL